MTTTQQINSARTQEELDTVFFQHLKETNQTLWPIEYYVTAEGIRIPVYETYEEVWNRTQDPMIKAIDLRWLEITRENIENTYREYPKRLEKEYQKLTKELVAA